MQLLMGTSISCMLEPADNKHIADMSSNLAGPSEHTESKGGEHTKFDSGHGPEPSQGIVRGPTSQQNGLHTAHTRSDHL